MTKQYLLQDNSMMQGITEVKALVLNSFNISRFPIAILQIEIIPERSFRKTAPNNDLGLTAIYTKIEY
jgi:hypothetical protein